MSRLIETRDVCKFWHFLFSIISYAFNYLNPYREAVVICVKNLSGFVSMSADGSWICEGDGRQKSEILPDPVSTFTYQIVVSFL